MSVVSSAEPSPIQRTGWRRPFERWLDGIEQGWAIPLFLMSFVAVWTIYLVVAYINADLHPDVLEAWSVGRTFSWGNAKHPPLMGWIANAWSAFFPLADWSFQLLAILNATIALWSVDLIARRFVRGDKRMVVLILLMLLPAYQFHAQRFNANTVLLAIWPLATYCFLRSFESKAVIWSIAAGMLCAAAMLGKYYSIFLVVAFVFAAVAHPQRRLYLSSSAPWISTLAGLLVLTPHLHWLATTGAVPLAYAIKSHGGATLAVALTEACMFVFGILAYLVLPVTLFLMMVRTRLKPLLADLIHLDSGLLLLALVFAATIVCPVITAVLLGNDLPSLWNLQGIFFVIVIAVCCTKFTIERRDTVNVFSFVVALWALALVASPFMPCIATAMDTTSNAIF